MDSAAHKAKIDALKAQIEASGLKCDAIAQAIEAAPSLAEKSALTRSLDKALQQKHTLQLALVLVERHGRGVKGAQSKPNRNARAPETAPGSATSN